MVIRWAAMGCNRQQRMHLLKVKYVPSAYALHFWITMCIPTTRCFSQASLMSRHTMAWMGIAIMAMYPVVLAVRALAKRHEFAVMEVSRRPTVH